MAYTQIEPLESRIAPAAITTFTDVDGDIVTITTSLGTKVLLDAAITKTAFGVTGGQRIDKIDLTNSAFDGTSLTVTARPGPLGGDGLVNVTAIDATGRNLAGVKVVGDLQELDAGAGQSGKPIPSIDVFSTSGNKIWTIKANVGAFKVKTNLSGAEIHIDETDFRVGLLSIGQSLEGVAGVIRSGYVKVGGKIVTAKIGRDIAGANAANSGYLEAGSIDSLTVGGSIHGGKGAGANAGQVKVTTRIGVAKVGGGIFGGVAAGNGAILSDSTLGDITVGGSLVGGGAADTGVIKAVGALGKIKIVGSIQGGSAAGSGQLLGGGAVGSIYVGGSVLGGTAVTTGRIFIDVPMAAAASTVIGPVTIRGNIEGSGSDNSGTVRMVSVQHNDQTFLKSIGAFTVNGSIIGGVGNCDGFQVMLDGPTPSIKVLGDVMGGAGSAAGSVRSSKTVGTYFIGGSLVGKAGQFSGSAGAFETIGTAYIGGDVKGGEEFFSGAFNATTGGINSLTVKGDILGGAGSSSGVIDTDYLGATVVKGSIVGTAASPYSILLNGDPPSSLGKKIVLKSLTVLGNVENAVIFANGTGDAYMGTINVAGDWIASTLSAGVLPDNNFWGDADDDVISGSDPALFSKIASITIGGQVRGTSTANDSFGFVAQEIGAFKVHGIALKLTAGRGNDTDLSTGGKLSLGAFRDVFIHELA